MNKKDSPTHGIKLEEKPLEEKNNLENIRRLLDVIEDNIRTIKKTLFSENFHSQAGQLNVEGECVEGVFDGAVMVDKNGKEYSVPANYASKSKLVAGDILKLNIAQDGTFIFKQIGPIERKKIVGIVQEEGGRFYVKAGKKNYDILFASATYFKLSQDDKVSIIIPKDQESSFAAVENKI